MEAKKLLTLRKEMNKRKPSFVITESHKYPNIKEKWRFPRGRHSKTRQMHCGRPPLPNIGYSAPKAVRGLSPEGLEIVLIGNIQQLSSINPIKQVVVVSSKIGTKKKLELLSLIQEKKITVLNIKDLNKKVEEIKSEFTARTELKEKRNKEKGKKDQEKKKKAEEKKVKEDKNAKESVKKSDEEKANEEKLKREQQKEKVEKAMFEKH